MDQFQARVVFVLGILCGLVIGSHPSVVIGATQTHISDPDFGLAQELENVDHGQEIPEFGASKKPATTRNGDASDEATIKFLGKASGGGKYQRQLLQASFPLPLSAPAQASEFNDR